MNSKCSSACSGFCPKCSQSRKLTKPIINSTLRHKQQIEQIQKTKPNCSSACTGFCPKCSQSRKLTKPIINSSLRHKQQIEQIQKTKFENEDCLLVPTKYTTKLNFGANHKLFRNLTPINVNDSLLLPKDKISIPKKYIRSNDKIPTPDLQDFLEAVSPRTFFVPEPEIKLDFMKFEFDVLASYKELVE